MNPQPDPHVRTARPSASLARRRRPWAPVLVAGLVLASAPFSVHPLRDAVTWGPAPGAELRFPAAYLALGPFSDLADAISLMTVRQHVAMLVTLLLAFAAWRALRRDGRRAGSAMRRVGREALAFVALLAAVLAFYAAAILLPRPMAALALRSADEVAVDFHTHTEASHDGRHGLSPERVRAWHRAAGFHVAYVTDHRTLQGAARALAGNPRTPGDEVLLFSGIELISGKLHLNVLGAAPADSAHFRLRVLEPDSVGRFRPADGSTPVILLTIPGGLERVRPEMGISAVEVSDAAPRGLQQTQREHAQIVRLADSLNLALLAASDNHGWGRTAAAWSLLRMPGWRTLPPDSLDRAIRSAIATHRRTAARAVERRLADERDSPLGIVATTPQVLWLMLRTLTWPQRAAWLAWTAVWLGMSMTFRRQRER